MSIIEALRTKIRKFETANAATHAVLPFGIPALDMHLPDGGLKLGALHEVAGGGDNASQGAAAALFASGILARTSGPILWCVRQRDLFAPALAHVGLAPERIVFVDAGDDRTLLACMEEGLRHGGLGGVVGEISKLPMTASRRLQLAAESTGTICIALWRWGAPKEQTAAHTAWRVTSQPSALLPVPGVGRGRWLIELMRCRGAESTAFEVEACDETGNIALPAELVLRPGEAADGRYSAAS